MNGSGALSGCGVDFSYRFTYYQVTYSIIFVLGLASNSRALWHRWHAAPTPGSTGVYMANLAMVDALFMVSLPLRVYYYYNRSRDGAWSPGAAFCRLTFTLKYVSMYGGIFFLACIGLDRYWAVTRGVPRRPNRGRGARSVSATVWLSALALSLSVPALQYITVRGEGPSEVPCQLDPSIGRHRAFILAALGLVEVAFLVPGALLLFSYCGVLRVLGRTRRRATFRRTLPLIYRVLGVFVLCFAPYHVNLVLYTLAHVGLAPGCALARAASALHPVALSLASANCCLNPLVYRGAGGGADPDTPSSRSSQREGVPT